MDAMLTNRARFPIDLVAEGMWKIAVGESCLECWDRLPENQKEWWRGCATQAVGEWMRGAQDSDHWGPRYTRQSDQPPGGRRFHALTRHLLGRWRS